MKKLLILLVVLQCCVVQAETWTVGDGLTATSRLSKAERSEKLVKLTLVGGVAVTSEQQGLTIHSDKMTLNARQDPKQKKAYLVDTAVATGHVVVLKAMPSKTGKQSTRIEGASAEYISGVNESIVKMPVPMKIQSFNEKGQPTMTGTGNSGVATLEPLKKTNFENALRKAVLDGNVHFDMTQYDPKSKSKSPTTLHTTSDHMVMENIADGKRITLTGSVHISADNFGDMKGASRAVIVINKAGRIEFETSGGK